MSQNCWLLKQEPAAYAWASLVREGGTAWTGVRNFQARNNLRAMRNGDLVLYYHSGAEKQVVGVARVVKQAYPDPTATDGDWSAVDIEPVGPLTHPVGLAALKTDPLLRDPPLFRMSRLSVIPVTREQYDRVLALGGTAGSAAGGEPRRLRPRARAR